MQPPLGIAPEAATLDGPVDAPEHVGLLGGREARQHVLHGGRAVDRRHAQGHALLVATVHHYALSPGRRGLYISS